MNKQFSAPAQVDISNTLSEKYNISNVVDKYIPQINTKINELSTKKIHKIDSNDVTPLKQTLHESENIIPRCLNILTQPCLKNIIMNALSKRTESNDQTGINDQIGINDQTEMIGLFDFLNLARCDISDRNDARFRTIDEFIENTMAIARNIKTLGKFHKIYLVTKSFRFNEKISYNDMVRIILWSFCKAIPEWQNEICLVLVNGINDKDREADDRALFILYNELSKINATKRVVIFSNDNFASIKSHYLRTVTLNHYYIKKNSDTWQSSEIVSKHKGTHQQNVRLPKKSYLVVRPNVNETNLITIF